MVAVAEPCPSQPGQSGPQRARSPNSRWSLGLCLLGSVGLAVATGARGSTSATAATPSTMSVIAHGADTSGMMSFTGVPSRLHAGLVTVKFHNGDHDEQHEAQLVRLTGGHTVADVKALVTRNPELNPPVWMVPAGGVDPVDPGVRASWTGVLGPGSYVLACFLTDTHGRSHAAMGMLDAFSVTGTAPAKMSLPKAPTATIGPNQFDIPTLAAGATSLRVVNNYSDAMEDVIVAVIKPGKTFADVLREAQSAGANGAPPPSLALIGGTSPVPHSTTVIGFEALQAGRTYVIADPSHLQDGAIAHFTAH